MKEKECSNSEKDIEMKNRLYVVSDCSLQQQRKKIKKAFMGPYVERS